MELFIVGQWRNPPEQWEFAGAFSSKERAEAACRDASYFVGPCNLDEQTPEARATWPGCYYPKA